MSKSDAIRAATKFQPEWLTVHEALVWICFRNWTAVRLVKEPPVHEHDNRSVILRLLAAATFREPSGLFRADGRPYPLRMGEGDAIYRLQEALKAGNVQAIDGCPDKKVPSKTWWHWRITSAYRINNVDHGAVVYFNNERYHNVLFSRNDLIKEWDPKFTKSFTNGRATIQEHNEIDECYILNSNESEIHKSIETLMISLGNNNNLKKDDAFDFLRGEVPTLSRNSFNNTIWPTARERVGLPIHAKAGRKPSRPSGNR